MNSNYKYVYTFFHVSGSILPSHKVFKNLTDNQAKLVFADNSCMYAEVSDWISNNRHLDTRKSTWKEESELFLSNELKALALYRDRNPSFKTEKNQFNSIVEDLDFITLR